MSKAELNLYYYKGRVERIIDGDSIIASIDFGLNSWIHNQRFRLAEINTPELRGDEREKGLAAKEWLINRLDGQEVIFKTDKDKKGRWGRWVVWLYVDDSCINDELIAAGHATEYMK